MNNYIITIHPLFDLMKLNRLSLSLWLGLRIFCGNFSKHQQGLSKCWDICLQQRKSDGLKTLSKQIMQTFESRLMLNLLPIGIADCSTVVSCKIYYADCVVTTLVVVIVACHYIYVCVLHIYTRTQYSTAKKKNFFKIYQILLFTSRSSSSSVIYLILNFIPGQQPLKIWDSTYLKQQWAILRSCCSWV